MNDELNRGRFNLQERGQVETGRADEDFMTERYQYQEPNISTSNRPNNQDHAGEKSRRTDGSLVDKAIRRAFFTVLSEKIPQPLIEKISRASNETDSD